MALPKKRKKLKTTSNSDTAASIPTEHTDEKKADCTKYSTGTAEKTKSSEQMNKAFEIIDRIDSANGTATTPEPGDSRPAHPGKIRFRISFDGSAPGPADMDETPGTAVDRSRAVDFGITIPSFVWKVPILKKAAKKVLQKLSPQD